jgi:hypothetical protein
MNWDAHASSKHGKEIRNGGLRILLGFKYMRTIKQHKKRILCKFGLVHTCPILLVSPLVHSV